MIKLIGGGQWNEAPNHKSDIISRAGIILTPQDTWEVKLLRAEAFHAPAALETTVYDPPVLVGNPNLSPETIITYDTQLFFHNQSIYGGITLNF